MAWIILSDDHPDRRHLRQDEALMQARVDWEIAIIDRLVAAGSTRSDDGESPTGGLMILDIETRAESESIFNQDPFVQAGLRTKVIMRRWFKAILDSTVRY